MAVKAWAIQALCAQVDPELWFPAPWDRSMRRNAQKVCARCPVTRQCLQFALETGSRDGIWGGLTAGEREPLHSAVWAGQSPAQVVADYRRAASVA